MSRYMRDNLQLEILRDISMDVVESDFVPYACLLDPDTIVTKNGELLQVIKITGFSYEAISSAEADLRNVIRKAISGAIQNDDYAIWLHTLRRKKKLSPDAEYPDAFSDHLHKEWKKRNNWDRKFINELYITIVREGQSADIRSPKGFINGLIPARDRHVRNNYLDNIAIELRETVDRMLKFLTEFGARRLTLVKRDGVYYGEHIEFLEKLINLEERPMPVMEADLSHYLTSGEITFAYNAMEVRTAEQLRRFGAVLTVKEYKEASLYRIDRFLQLPCEFIVTQCFDFINARKALSSYQAQRYYLQVSGDIELAEQSELTHILRNNRNNQTDYGEQQTSIFVIGENIRELESNIRMMRDTLTDAGILTIREDIRFEDCYWAQLPANFEFISRLSYTNAQHLGGFVNIQNYPGGNAAGCPWGKPVSLFYTAAGTPYFFNFHLGDNGHTTVVGPRGSGKSVLINFLLSESRKYRNRLFYLDAHGHSEQFVQAIGGNYFKLSSPQSQHYMSPLSLPDSKANQEFVALWLTTLIDPTGQMVNDALLQFLKSVVAQLFTSAPDQRSLRKVADMIGQQDPMLAQQFAPWYGTGQHAFYFDHPSESIEPKGGIIGFDLSGILHQPALLVPVVSYLLHRITMTLDGTPSIIVLDEGWRLLNNPMFAPRVAGWMQYLTSKNAFAIFSTEEVPETATYGFSAHIVQQAATQIYMPDDDPDDAYSDVFGLSDEEYAYLDAMNVEYRHFLLKRANETIVAELNLGGMDKALQVLSGGLHLVKPDEETALPYRIGQES